jgi:hypothetical protein
MLTSARHLMRCSASTFHAIDLFSVARLGQAMLR